jgi:hypothetical protein
VRPVHSGQLARYLGDDAVGRVSRMMRGWYGPPIALADVPGSVWCHGDGEFYGTLKAGYEASAVDRAIDLYRRSLRAYRRACRPQPLLAAGFANLADLIAEAMSGKGTDIPIYKPTPAPAGAGEAYCAAYVGTGAIATPGNAPDGTVYSSSSADATKLPNVVSGDGLYLAGARLHSSVASSYLLYDHLFGVNKAVSSTTAQAVTGVPTRYQSTTPTDWDWCGGNFVLAITNGSVSSAVHNWTVCQYTDQDGNTGVSFPSVPGYSSSRSWVIDVLNGAICNWFIPLDVGDVGVKALTQIQIDVSNIQPRHFIQGHPLGIFSSALAGTIVNAERVTTALSMVRIATDACLQFLVPSSSASAPNLTCNLRVVSG